MAVNLFRRMTAIFGQTAREDGVPTEATLTDALDSNRYDLLCLAEQIQAHAERAPYPHVTRSLEQIALEKRNSAEFLRKEILNLGGNPSAPRLDVKSGKNHWERIKHDIEDQKVLLGQLLEASARWAEEAPQIGEVLQRIARIENSHRETLMRLLMRADPQAEQN